MSTTTTIKVATHTLDVPGATLTYDVRANDASSEPVLLMIGTPMGAAGFTTLAGHFTDRTVVTYDPRGSERSVLVDPASPITPDIHADDVHRVIEAIGGPVDCFASSGGADQLPRPRRQASRGRADARCPRAAACLPRAGSRVRAGRLPGGP